MSNKDKVNYRVWKSYPTSRMHYPNNYESIDHHDEHMIKGSVPDLEGKIPYECDIIDYKGNIGILHWNKDSLKLQINWIIQSKKLSTAEFMVASSRIIGNLFENPELVKLSNEE